MSHFLDRLTFFNRPAEAISNGHGITTHEDRRWEDGYRKRWQHDKIVRSTHGANCTGSCSWKIYVKGGIVTWETQQTDYPRTRPDLPNHEPRGCSRGASYSWYLYSGNRVKYPLVRSRLLKLWRDARVVRTPVGAWASIVEDPEKRNAYTSKRGLGGFVRATWDEVNEIIAAANAYTIKKIRPRPRHRLLADPGDVDGVLRRRLALSLAARRRVHVVLRLVLRPAAVLAADLGRADRRSRKRRLVQLGLPDPVGLQCSADPHARRAFLHRSALSRRQERRDLARLFARPRNSRTSGSPEAGTDAALAMAMGHVILKEFYLESAGAIFRGLCPPIHRHADAGAAGEAGRHGCVPDRLLRASDFANGLGEANNPEWKTVAFDETPVASSSPADRSASDGARRASGTWRRRSRAAAAPICG